MGKFLEECFLQKTNQFDALKVLKKPSNLKVSTELQFKLDPVDDDSEKKVVSLYTKGASPKKIGVLNDDDAKDIKKFLEAKWEDNSLFECIVSRYDDKADENKRISVAIFIKEKE